jgi:hypothetical protein
MRRPRLLTQRGFAVVAAAVVALAVAPAAVAQGTAGFGGFGGSGHGTQVDVARVRAATAPFHVLHLALHAGYTKFLDCMDDGVSRGMGQHYVNTALLADNGALDKNHPEALVYDVSSGTPRLVAVEYVVPGAPTDPAPHLLGQTFTYNAELGVWKLHFWIWRANPDGIFKDFSPRVPLCSGPSMSMQEHTH